MPLLGKNARVWAKVGSTWWALPGLSDLEQADSAGGGVTRSPAFEDEDVYVSSEASTVGNFTLTCSNFSNDDLYRWLLAQEKAGATVQLEAVIGGHGAVTPYFKSDTGVQALVSIAIDGTLTFAPIDGMGNLLNTMGLRNPVRRGDMLLVNGTAGATNYTDVGAEAYSIAAIGNATTKAKVHNFNIDGSARLSAIIAASGFAILPPRQKVAFGAPVTSASGISLSGQTTPATRTPTYPNTPLSLIHI